MAGYLLAGASAIALVIIASVLIRKLRSASDDGDPAGPTVAHAGSMISALFLIAFAIAIVVPWTTADAARLNTYAESQAIAEASWSAAELPAASVATIQTGLHDYARFVKDAEWPLMADGKLSPEGWARLEDLRKGVVDLQVKGNDEEEAQASVLQHISEISATRRQRAMDAAATPPPSLLGVTVATGLAVLVLPLLGGARPRGMALLPLALMAVLLGMGIYLTVDISRVFDGALAVTPDAFSGLLSELQRISWSA
ncbi:DUF4239 domain-containing protein [Nonomuraea soli]|uniref:DUF4239 domain-containing protein n=1 Tax=Nonomuraea soli TaxID=1032476 RepID=A0A7W0CN77_9ACTN|nr:DUF4239 domain-containing protein [Nonomuraea soli]MBA2894050.1 hypothetical protein [Nonomuraea soli]